MEDNHLWKLRDNSYDKEAYYDTRYEQGGLVEPEEEWLTPEEVRSLSEELGELSEFEEQNKERMQEIAHILNEHYMSKAKKKRPN